MTDYNRETPYNYTSFSDREIVLRYLDSKSWDSLEELKQQRATGVSAQTLFELLGEMWVIDRNPFLFDDILNDPKRQATLLKVQQERVQQIQARRAKTASSDRVSEAAQARSEKVKTLMQQVERSVAAFDKEFNKVRTLRAKYKKAFAGIAPASNVLFDGHARVSHVTDATDWRVEYPFMVLAPDTDAEVHAMVNKCIELNIPMIPRGGGTGYTGSAVPLNRYSAVINIEKLDRLQPVQVESKLQGVAQPYPTIEVGSGVVTKRVAEAAEAKGLVFAVDPTSQEASTIGGNIAMNAGGKKAVMWGTALDNLVSWRMVMPNGHWCDVVRINHNLGKIHDQEWVEFSVMQWAESPDTPLSKQTIRVEGSSFRHHGLGKDVTDKFLSGIPGIQKEGCDGIITSASFILHTLPKHTHTVCLEFYDYDLRRSVPAIVEIRDFFKAHSEIVLSGLEHLDWRYVKAVKYTPKANRGIIPRMVLLADISADSIDDLNSATRSMVDMTEKRGGEGFIATDAALRGKYWAPRKRTAAIAAHTNAFKINEDVVIPLEALGEYSEGIERINIEQSIANKIQTVKALAAFFKGDNYLQATSHLSSDQEHAIAKSKQIAALDILNSAIKEWSMQLDTVKSAVHELDHASRDDSLLGQFLRHETRVSLKKSVIAPLKDLFQGQTMIPVVDGLTKVHDKHRNQRLFIALHMHAGDGNVHTNIPVHSSNNEMLEEADRVVDRVMALAKGLDGVISGEHGIGLTKMKYLDDAQIQPFLKYKKEVDAKQLFNPGKLQPGSGLDNAYTPSFQLLEAEALILEESELGQLNDDIKDCLRCGKCKPVCATHIPRANLLYSPRNKILATGLIIEAILYNEQTQREMSYSHYDQMNDVADHCTMCHKCLSPCPVNIDFGDVTARLRSILLKEEKRKRHVKISTPSVKVPFMDFTLEPKTLVNHDIPLVMRRSQRRSHVFSKLAMAFLTTKSSRSIDVFRSGMINFGFGGQRLASKVLRSVYKPAGQGVSIPASTTGTPSVMRQVVQFTSNPLPSLPQRVTLREIIDAKGKDILPVIHGGDKDNYQENEAVFYFPGCGSERLFSDIGLATIGHLLDQQTTVVLPPGYLCCGYPQKANGQAELASRISTTNRVLFHRVESKLNYLAIKNVIVSCGTCMDQLLDYHFDQIFKDSRQLDIHEFLKEKGVHLNGDQSTEYVYHEPCHSPMKTYDSIDVASELLGKEVQLSERCCGESGTFGISRPDIAEQVRFRKTESLKQSFEAIKVKKPETKDIKILTSCPSCQQGLSRYEASTGVQSEYIIVEMAKQKHGKEWRKIYTDKIAAQIERVAF